MKIQGCVVVVDFEHHIDFIEPEATDVVFLVGLVGVAKIVEHSDGLDETSDRFGSQGGYSCCDHGAAAEKVLPKVIVERANTVRVRGHGCVSIGDVGLALDRLIRL
jgi:hypothetical protein